MHTPGPWKANRRFIQRGDGSDDIAEVLGNKEEEEGNASLIAAAPDLLDIVIDTLRRFKECRASEPSDPCLCPYCPAARAYEKATGKEWNGCW